MRSTLEKLTVFSLLLTCSGAYLAANEKPNSEFETIVDGSKNPELISNELALEHFIGTVASLGANDPDNSHRTQLAYLSYFFKEGCGPTKDDLRLTTEQLLKLVKFAEESQSKRLQADNNSNYEERTKLFRLLFSNLSNSLGVTTAQTLQNHLDTQVKPGIKIVAPKVN